MPDTGTCSTCGGGFQYGILNMNQDSEDRGCRVCGTELCSRCCDSWWSSTDTLVKLCQACRETYGIREDRPDDAKLASFGELLASQGSSPRCAGCGRSPAQAESYQELNRCFDCRAWFCSGCCHAAEGSFLLRCGSCLGEEGELEAAVAAARRECEARGDVWDPLMIGVIRNRVRKQQESRKEGRSLLATLASWFGRA